MRFLLAIAAFILAAPTAVASTVDDAASLLSRFPQGHVPSSLAVLGALGTIADAGDEEHTSLLESLIKDENEKVALAASEALGIIASRERESLRRSFRAPTSAQIDGLAHRLRDPTVQLGQYERRMLAYAVLVLGDIPSNRLVQWQEDRQAHEDAGDPRKALQVLVQAAALGDSDAQLAIASYGVNFEQLVLGVWTAWCPDDSDTSKTLETLVEVGSIHTVRVLANRASRSRAYHRAIALDGLSRMLAKGKLTDSATALARTGLISATQDPHTDVRVLARTALNELRD